MPVVCLGLYNSTKCQFRHQLQTHGEGDADKEKSVSRGWTEVVGENMSRSNILILGPNLKCLCYGS